MMRSMSQTSSSLATISRSPPGVGKIVDGKVEAYYRQVALMSQEWIRDPKKTIGDLVKELSAKVGENVVVRRFARFQLGQE